MTGGGWCGSSGRSRVSRRTGRHLAAGWRTPTGRWRPRCTGELAEELGAEASEASQVFLFSSPSDSGVAVQHFFVARLVGMDEARRGGPEFADPARGGYDVDRVDLLGGDLAGVDLKPGVLKEFIVDRQ